MKTRMLLMAVAMLVFVGASFGQGFSVFFYDDSYQLKASTPTGCQDGDPLGDGTIAWIMQDLNHNGPDAADQPATLCADPPDCPNGPVFAHNINQIVFNGELYGAGPGYFYADYNFQCVGAIDTATSYYYLRINCNDGSPHFLSPVYHFTSSTPQDISVTQWTCITCVVVPPCQPTPEVDFQHFPLPAYFCADLCPGAVTIVRVCGVADPTKPPIVSVVPGCEPVVTHCDRQCPPAQFIFDPNAWAFDPATGCWTNIIIGTTEGCVCITLEGFLAVGFNNDFAALPMDNSVKLSWSTSSENGMQRYDIIRNGDKVGEVPAANAAHTYNYVDESAVNGTTYTYTLRAINNDATVNELGSVEATPSFGAAVVTEYALLQNFPNPFNPSTEIAFDVLNSNTVTLKVYNAAGQEVSTLINGARYDGGHRYAVSFNASNLPSGLYFYTVKIGNDFSATKKMLLVK
jgi:hypothetical protein